MKAYRLLTLASISLLAMSGCNKKGEVSPADGATTGRLVKMQLTYDMPGQNTQPRWIVDVAPLTLEGYQGKLYAQAKVFNLPTNVTYQEGQVLSFHYQLVPYAQQTPYKTGYEWGAVPPGPPGATALPEIILSDVH
ncbi:hypothetical protein GCM10027422_35090 [Hymenobacter arcticus]